MSIMAAVRLNARKPAIVLKNTCTAVLIMFTLRLSNQQFKFEPGVRGRQLCLKENFSGQTSE